MSAHVPKYRLPFRITLQNETVIYCIMFMRQDQRAIDMLCDERPFFPIESTEGVHLIAKSSVMKVDVLSRDEVDENLHVLPPFDHEQLDREERQGQRTPRRDTARRKINFRD